MSIEKKCDFCTIGDNICGSYSIHIKNTSKSSLEIKCFGGDMCIGCYERILKEWLKEKEEWEANKREKNENSL
jgi:hypothetical protein